MLFILRSRELPEPQAFHCWHEQSHVQMAIESCKYSAGQRLLSSSSFPAPHSHPIEPLEWEVPGVLTRCAPHISRVLLLSFCDTVSHWS